MLRKLLISLCLLFFSPAVWTQHSIHGTLIGVSPEKVMLLKTVGSKQLIIDSTRLDETGSFSLSVPLETQIGQYQVFTESGLSFDIIYNKENIQLIALYDGYDHQIQVIESEENKLYYQFVNLKKYNLLKLDILSTVIDYYPREDPFYQKTVNKALELQTEINRKGNELIINNPLMLATHFLRASMPVFADLMQSEDQKKIFLKQHYFDYVDFNDTVLINSQVLNSKIINYLSLYQDNKADQETFEMYLLAGVDTVLTKASINEKMYTYVVDFLIGGFEAIGFEKGLEHIASHNILDELCVNDERLGMLQNKIELINRLAIGKQAPAFQSFDTEDKPIDLYKIKAKKTLLFFWASWCPYCKDLIPDLNELSNLPKEDFQLIGISIDTSFSALKSVMNEYEISWPVIAELDGWESKISNQYGIAATPTLFLLDEYKIIRAKPANKEALLKLFR